jgi:flagellar biosynthesis protein
MTAKNKQKRAAALRYQPKADIAPKVVAKGTGKVAERIIEIAKEHDIHIHNDPDLVEVLSQLDLNEAIPPDLYVVVAELLAFVYALNSGEKLR